jgi:hypothetical protein
MTEAEWLASTNPIEMLESLPQPLSDRKLRLWMTACHRRVWHLLTGLERRMPEATELYLEGRITLAQFDAAYIGNGLFDDDHAPTPEEYSLHRALNEVEYITEYANDPEEEMSAQADLVREIFGNPFRAVTVEPTWLAWNGGEIPRLAQSIYDNRKLPEAVLDPAQMAALADALEQAGCANEALLSHCRGTGPHVLGCWPVDLILSKER